MLQLRITEQDGSDPVIFNNVENISLTSVINDSGDGVTFSVPKNITKSDIINPDNYGYKKFWEIWDTESNTRLNHGPITNITDNITSWSVEGAGVSQLLNDLIKTVKTFYKPIDSIIDSLLYENIAAEPRTTTLIHPTTHSGLPLVGSKWSSKPVDIFDDTLMHFDYGFNGFFTMPLGVNVDENYHGLSLNTKDNCIDDNNGLLSPGQIEPPKTYFTTNSYWSGMSTNDAIIVDLGEKYDISKISLLFPWWGGAQRANNRTYDFTLSFTTSGGYYDWDGRTFGRWQYLYQVFDNQLVTFPDTPMEFYIGMTTSGTSPNPNATYLYPTSTFTSIPMQYVKVHITDVHAWYGTSYDDEASVDGWEYQCDPDYINGDNPGLNRETGIMTGKTINDRTLENANDCHASIVEVGIYKKFMDKAILKPLALQKIDNNNLQITYYHTPDSSETFTTSTGYRKFEPGASFRRFSVTWSDANTVYTKFYPKDCTNCYPDGFNFAVLDQNNSMVISSDDSSGTDVFFKSNAFTKHLVMKGASTAVVTYCDAWQARMDALSWGGSYSYSKIQNDYFIVHFYGESFKWYVTVPSDETGATVKIEIREKVRANPEYNLGYNIPSEYWTNWSTLEDSLTLPSGVSSHVAYEIQYNSGILEEGKIYEIKITNLDGGFCSLDAIEGYWAGSFTMYNEDSAKIRISQPDKVKQIYDKRFTNGSIYKWNTTTGISMLFEGDRIIILSARGRNHGKLTLQLFYYGNTYGLYDPGVEQHVFIPGGDPNDGSITISCATAKRATEVPSWVLFDSNEAFVNGLPWGRYGVSIRMRERESYTAQKAEIDSDSFVYRCSNCKTSTGTVNSYKYVYLDGIGVHEKVGLSVSFENETHLDILRSVAEAVQVEWQVTENGIKFEPRIGTDTNEVLHEGQNTLVDFEVVNDVSQVASMLVSSGADIEGLPLFAITEDKTTRSLMGRTIMRKHDFRDIADYFQLIGLSRAELMRRRAPEKRITVRHVANNLDLDPGDSFILYTRKMGPLRVRINTKIRNQTASGTEFELECVKWPPII